MLIRDKGDKSKYWVQRIEFKPWKPSDFLEADVRLQRESPGTARQAQGQGQTSPFPWTRPRPDPGPLRDQSPAGGLGKGTIEVAIAARQFPPCDYARDISRQGLRLFFNIDGYPHALQYISPDWSNQPGKIEPDDTVEVKITSPKPDAPFDASPDKQPVKVLLNFEVYARSRFPGPSRK